MEGSLQKDRNPPVLEQVDKVIASLRPMVGQRGQRGDSFGFIFVTSLQVGNKSLKAVDVGHQVGPFFSGPFMLARYQ